MKKPIEIHPIEAVCYVCKRTVPMEELQDCGLGTYRCKKHRGSTILKAGEKYEQEKRTTTRRFTLNVDITVRGSIEITEEIS